MSFAVVALATSAAGFLLGVGWVFGGMLCALALMAALGLFEIKAGRVRAGILASVVLELVLAAGFAWVLATE